LRHFGKRAKNDASLIGDGDAFALAGGRGERAANHESRLVRDIRTALAAIEEGSYGQCQDCEEPIPRRRLDAVPWARLCVPCQSKVEAAREDGMAALSDAA
jgi:RNA polymerase-binding transcription factor DksA